MCGIAGIFDRNAKHTVAVRTRRMSETIIHRGPDGGDLWSDTQAGIALGHRRLAIVDLSDSGRQPMASQCGRYYLTYNGEIYNVGELRNRLIAHGIRFRGTSDTEVIVNAISIFGLDDTLLELNGIYAFGVWDRREKTLALVRDRVGVKPLFWSYHNGALLFASELRALAALPEFDRTIDLAAVGSFLQFNYIRSPMTIYRAARALEPGHVLTITADGQLRQRQYWNLADIVSQKSAQREAAVDAEEAVNRLESLLSDAVRRQLVSDVPIGAFLSGGVDSSTVVALMQQAATEPVRSFSIGFETPDLNEAEMAKAVAAHVGAQHTELIVSEQAALDCIPHLPALYDQPLADPSSIPTYLLCKLAREHVTVALSGDGGDELFSGYTRYGDAERVYALFKRIPKAARATAHLSANAIGAHRFRRRGFEAAGKAARMAWHSARLIEYASDDVRDVYLHFVSHWSEPDAIAPDTRADTARWLASKRATSRFDELLMLHDFTSYMTDGVLAKVDRASMAASMEVRVPLLDHRVIEFAWGLPQNVKSRDATRKWCLRRILYRHVPQALVDRPKAGFGAPIGSWLRGAARDWSEHLLSPQLLKKWAIIDPDAAREVWSAHRSNKVDASSRLWSLLMLQGWLEENQPPAQPIEACDTREASALQ